MPDTKLLSFDTSSKSTGVGIYVNGEYSSCQCIDFSKTVLMQERLQPMVKAIIELIDKEKPSIVAVETTAVNRNAQTQRFLTMIIGAIYGKCVEDDIYFESFTPSQWRSLVSREKRPTKRQELKQWSKDKVKEIFGFEINNDDISDAILIGFAYINKYKGAQTE